MAIDKDARQISDLASQLRKGMAMLGKDISILDEGVRNADFGKTMEQAARYVEEYTAGLKSESSIVKAQQMASQELTKSMKGNAAELLSNYVTLTRIRKDIASTQKEMSGKYRLQALMHEATDVDRSMKGLTAKEIKDQQEGITTLAKQLHQALATSNVASKPEIKAMLAKGPEHYATSQGALMPLIHAIDDNILSQDSLEKTLEGLQAEEKLVVNTMKKDITAQKEHHGMMGGVIKKFGKYFAELELGKLAYATAKELAARDEATKVISASSGVARNSLISVSDTIIPFNESMKMANEMLEKGAFNKKNMLSMSSDIHRFAAVFGTTESGLTANIMDFNEDLVLTGAQLSSSIDTTVRKLVGLGRSSGLGAVAIENMYKSAVEFTKGLTDVFSPKQKRELATQMTQMEAYLTAPRAKGGLNLSPAIAQGLAETAQHVIKETMTGSVATASKLLGPAGGALITQMKSITRNSPIPSNLYKNVEQALLNNPIYRNQLLATGAAQQAMTRAGTYSGTVADVLAALGGGGGIKLHPERVAAEKLIDANEKQAAATRDASALYEAEATKLLVENQVQSGLLRQANSTLLDIAKTLKWTQKEVIKPAYVVGTKPLNYSQSRTNIQKLVPYEPGLAFGK